MPFTLLLLALPVGSPAVNATPLDLGAALPIQEPSQKKAGDKPIQKPTKKELAALGAELKEMMRLDQIHRTPVSWGTTDPEELKRLEALDDDAHLAEWARRNREGISLPPAQEKELMRLQGLLDAANVKRLTEIIRKHGYPDPEKFDIDAPDPLPVLIHAPMDAYDSIAPTLLKEAIAGRLDARPYAALTDRKRQHRGLIQIYGMCRMMDRKTGKTLPPEIENIEATNKARAKLGMPPLTEFRLCSTVQ